MSLVTFTRPDGSPIVVNPDSIISFAEVPSGALAGPLTHGTRIVFANQTHLDVKELVTQVTDHINAARAQHFTAFATAMASANPGLIKSLQPYDGTVSDDQASGRSGPLVAPTAPTPSAARPASKNRGSGRRRMSVQPYDGKKP